MQLSKIAVRDLFGLFTHTIELRREDRVTILHGPNGVGKTVILRLVQSFFDGRYDLLLDTNFSRFDLVLTDGRSVSVERVRKDASSAGSSHSLIISDPETADSHEWTRDRAEYKRIASFIDNETPYVTRLSDDQWLDDRTGDVCDLAELIHRFGDALPEKLKSPIVKDPTWLRSFRDSVRVHFVETQRLLTTKLRIEEVRYRIVRQTARKPYASTVKSYSADLAKEIGLALTLYAEHSQSLDRSFPQRMLGGLTTDALNTDDLKDRMNKLELRRAQLKKIGLIEDDASYPFDIDTLDGATATQKAVMTLYVQDTESKLGVLDDLQRKVDLLLGNINRKFQPNKRLRSDRKSGLTVRDRNENRIDLDSLSSGEQHELVLVYDLLFRVRPNTLVLLDEPELSLHVTWQKAFLNELFAIISAGDFDVVLATHSPFIVGDRTDLMVPLALEPADLESITATAAAKEEIADLQ